MYRIQVLPKTLHFKQPAGTSRGIYTIRKVWYVVLSSDEQPERKGWGECAPLPQLSCDDLPDYEDILKSACRDVEASGRIDKEALRPYPSILFGLETALRHYEQQSVALWDTPFSRGEAGIPINGLIWMGNYERMLEQIRVKMETGFRCIKLKIGAIHFEEELDLLAFIRKHFSAKEVELRVDANGAFQPDTALEKLKRLAELDLHSIEQPIRAGQWEEMARLCAVTPLPIALDEEHARTETGTARHHPSAIHHPEAFAARSDVRFGRMDSGSRETADQLVDYFGPRVEHRTECHRAVVCHVPESAAARTGHRRFIYG